MPLSPIEEARVQQFRASEKHRPLEERAQLLTSASRTFAGSPLSYGLSEAGRGAVTSGVGGAILLSTMPLIEGGIRAAGERAYRKPFASNLGQAIATAGGDVDKVLQQAGSDLELLSERTGMGIEETRELFKKRVQEAFARKEFEEGAEIAKKLLRHGAPEPLDAPVGRMVTSMAAEEVGAYKPLKSGVKWVRKHKWPLLLGSMGVFGMLRGIKQVARANEASKRSLEEQAKKLEEADIDIALRAGQPSIGSMALPLLYMSATG